MKVNLIMKKEDIDPNKMEGRIAVIFDVLLATSTINACFHYGAKNVIPARDGVEAIQIAKKFHPDEIVIVGEENGRTIDGFLDPMPSVLRNKVKDKTVILSTTNGTVAIRSSDKAKKVYIASLLNAVHVAEQIITKYGNDPISVVCSGSSNHFCLEDFYGAGYFIHTLVQKIGPSKINLSDSSLCARLFYEKYENEPMDILSQSRVGRLLMFNYIEDINYISQKRILPFIPVLSGENQIILEAPTEVEHQLTQG